jgi:hypothetical protein
MFAALIQQNIQLCRAAVTLLDSSNTVRTQKYNKQFDGTKRVNICGFEPVQLVQLTVAVMLLD